MKNIRRIIMVIVCCALLVQTITVPVGAQETEGYVPKLMVTDIFPEGEVNLEWNEDENADGYEVYRSEGAIDGEYTCINTIDYAYDTSCYVDDLQRAHRYYFKVRAYYVGEGYFDENTWEWIEGERQYSEFSEPVEVVIPMEAVTGLTVKRVSYQSLRLTWTENADAEGYFVQRSDSYAGEYQTIAIIQDRTKTSYTDTGLVMGTKYYYKVVGFVGAQGEEIVSQDSVVVSGTPNLAKATSVQSKCPTPKKLKLTWKKVEDAQGYVVYKTAADKTVWKKYKTLSGAGKTVTSFSVSNGKCYGVRIAAYRVVNGKKVEGLVKEVSVYGDYYGYERESYESRYKRVYGSLKKSQYQSAAQAQKNMTTIKIKVWDFAKGMSGKKITKIKYVTCNKAVAPTLKKVFQKIYNGKEKAPIYEVGGFSWRSGQHGQGLAVDINADYNAMFDDGKPVVGKCWNPKKYAYSIKRHGDIENAFEEYGFFRGFWGTREDYMHFSYFGT